MPNPFVPARKTATGLRLRATDTGWTWASHPSARLAVEGRAADLASVLGGRPWALPRLAGSGIPELAARITPGCGDLMAAALVSSTTTPA